MTAIPSDQTHRLAFIKHLLSTAADHAQLPEPFSSKAVLELHDSVELFLQLLVEHLGVTLSKKSDFLEYWPAIAEKLAVDLPMQPAMKRLNQARVSLKHSGIRPSRDEIKDFAQKTVEFFDQACRLIFDVPLEGLSAISLVGYEPEASRLLRAEALGAKGDFGESAQMCALAFYEIMERFRTVAADDAWRHSPFPRLSEVTHFSGISLGYEWSKQNHQLTDHLDKIAHAFSEIEPVLFMQVLGIDYREYFRFAKVTPDIDGMMDRSVILNGNPHALSERDTLFAIDFVTRDSVCLRELDPDPQPHAEHPFASQAHFAVTLPARATVPERMVRGSLVEIGGGFEAWIFHGQVLARVCRGDSRNAAIAYLERYRDERERDAEREKAAPG